jgi:hypothetical protein
MRNGTKAGAGTIDNLPPFGISAIGRHYFEPETVPGDLFSSLIDVTP